MLTAMTAAALALAALTPTDAADTPPGRVTIDVVTVNGSGCPAGTAAVASAADNTAFTVTYSDYLAQTGAGAKPTDFRKNCQLVLRVYYPQGFTFGIAQADYRGFAHLATGARGVERANYYFQGMSQSTPRTHTFTGPMSDNWQATDRTEVGAIVYAPCGEQRMLNVNTQLRVQGGASFMTMDSTDASFSTNYHFSWKKC
ncbi:DUF4360 domain-containing protein [Lentzea sp. BCCO 10_0856]|uniref:DUF4360 domain-containing protein n=1 Tax=Lentzea miocenica TaxID=3095431 RepID=A0ABU4T9K9_9PSEU|nr:DUF4360 domain-containing protein [Lentzea sp. BCCO 10_0856]MDX8034865.1 DUF4360 domain-containing protein [Lentzea sp. BCCO 10_0856]